MVSFNPQDFQELGLRLVLSENNEAGYRTAINRVYFACHLIGVESTTQKGWFKPKYGAQDHSGICRELDKHNRLGDKLRSLVEMREHADYHIALKPEFANCQYCKNRNGVQPLVDEGIWNRAKEIAIDILPKLQSIDP